MNVILIFLILILIFHLKNVKCPLTPHDSDGKESNLSSGSSTYRTANDDNEDESQSSYETENEADHEEESSYLDGRKLDRGEQDFHEGNWHVRCKSLNSLQDHDWPRVRKFVEHFLDGKNPWQDLLYVRPLSEAQAHWSQFCQLLLNKTSVKNFEQHCRHSAKDIFLSASEQRSNFSVRLAGSVIPVEQNTVKLDFLRCRCSFMVSDWRNTEYKQRIIFYVSRFSDTEYFKMTDDGELNKGHLTIVEYCKLTPNSD